MSIKGKESVADRLDWDRAVRKGEQLISDDKTRLFGLYILTSIYTGFRVSDILGLTWEQLRSGEIKLKEQKTSKHNKRELHDDLMKYIKQCDRNEYGFVFVSQKGGVFRTQTINAKLKDMFSREVKKGLQISSHSLRKTFGRRVYEVNNESDRILHMLSDMFNHTSTSVTRRYLGIRDEEIREAYLKI